VSQVQKMAKSIKSRVAAELAMWSMPRPASVPNYGAATVSRLLALLEELHNEYIVVETELERLHQDQMDLEY